MDKQKEKAIKLIVDGAITDFSTGFEGRYEREVNDPKGVINSKKNNCFIAELGEEFMFYSAFVRSFDSSFGKFYYNLANRISWLCQDKLASLFPVDTLAVKKFWNDVCDDSDGYHIISKQFKSTVLSLRKMYGFELNWIINSVYEELRECYDKS